jgi:hypothetical protein
MFFNFNLLKYLSSLHFSGLSDFTLPSVSQKCIYKSSVSASSSVSFAQSIVTRHVLSKVISALSSFL